MSVALGARLRVPERFDHSKRSETQFLFVGTFLVQTLKRIDPLKRFREKLSAQTIFLAVETFLPLKRSKTLFQNAQNVCTLSTSCCLHVAASPRRMHDEL